MLQPYPHILDFQVVSCLWIVASCSREEGCIWEPLCCHLDDVTPLHAWFHLETMLS